MASSFRIISNYSLWIHPLWWTLGTVMRALKIHMLWSLARIVKQTLKPSFPQSLWAMRLWSNDRLALGVVSCLSLISEASHPWYFKYSSNLFSLSSSGRNYTCNSLVWEFSLKYLKFRAFLLAQWLKKKKRKKISLQYSRHRLDPWVGKIPWRRKWQPTPVFLPGKSHGQRRLAVYSPWGHKRVRHDLGTKQQIFKFTNSILSHI